MRTIPLVAQMMIGMVLGTVGAANDHFKADTTINGLRIELHVLPAEPFFTKNQVSAEKAKEGMVIIGGAKPLGLDAETKPTHHLVVHIFDSLTAKAITNAKVEMSYQALDEKGEQLGHPVQVPVVVMQSIGKDEESTHYGNNVIMRDGPYVVSVVVNSRKIKFKINKLFEPMAPSKSTESKEFKLTH